jgi:RimJ/RimL family protein N-acetyltransferase
VPEDRALFDAAVAALAASDDPLFFAVVDRATGRCEGRQALLRIEPAHGVVELGHILWGPGIARSRAATEAFALTAGYVFDTLGYRRLEWKCDADNAASRQAAIRFGFAYEGRFRQHMVVKGRNRDTAWFALLDEEWPARREALEAWLAPSNFDDAGRQRTPLRRHGARSAP